MIIFLRPYQSDLHQQALGILRAEPARDLAVVHPTGSGKTVSMLALAAAWLADRPQGRVLIAATQEHIEDAFLRPWYDQIGVAGAFSLCLDVPGRRAARDETAGAIATIQEFLQAGGAPEEEAEADRVLVTTHAALARVRFDITPPALLDLSQYLLLLDEGHHGPALALGQFLKRWRQHGGRQVIFTATDFRMDGDPVTEDMQVLRRTLPQHMDEGYAPEKIVTRIIRGELSQATDQHVDVFHGDAPPPLANDNTAIAETLARLWCLDQRPKTIVRVPVQRGGSSALVQALLQSFTAAGARVLDATGQHPAVAVHLREVLRRERSLTTVHGSTVDVIIGIQRVAEGLDWPLCSHVYCIGLPRSIPLAIQLLGRATRLKSLAGYDEDQRRKATITFYVPNGENTPQGGGAELELHRRYTLLTCAYLVSAEAGAEWACLRDLGLSLGQTWGTAVRQAIVNHYPYVDPTQRAEVLVMLASAVATLRQRGAPYDVPDALVLDEVLRAWPQVQPALVRQVLAEQTAAAGGEPWQRLRQRLVEYMRRRTVTAPPDAREYRRLLDAAFERVLPDLDAFVIAQDPRLAQLRTQALQLTGRDINELARRLISSRPLTPTWLAVAVQRWRNVHGRWPTRRDQDGPLGWPDESWAELDVALWRQQRHWPHATITSLAQFISTMIRNGTVASLLREWELTLLPTKAESAFLRHLAEQPYWLSDGSLVAFKDVLLSANVADWGPMVMHEVQRWATRFATDWQVAGPLARRYAELLASNIGLWLTLRHGAAPVTPLMPSPPLEGTWRNNEAQATQTFSGAVPAVPGAGCYLPPELVDANGQIIPFAHVLACADMAPGAVSHNTPPDWEQQLRRLPVLPAGNEEHAA